MKNRSIAACWRLFAAPLLCVVPMAVNVSCLAYDRALRCRKQSSFQARCAPQRSQSYLRDSGCGNRAASHALQMALERGHGPAPCRVYMSLLTTVAATGAPGAASLHSSGWGWTVAVSHQSRLKCRARRSGQRAWSCRG